MKRAQPAARAARRRLGAALPLGLVLLLMVATPPIARAAAPRVAVSIKPVHSLVASIMEGVATPDLIVRGGASEHGYTLRPSDAKRLSEAQLVFWVGPLLENYLEQPLSALAGQATVVELATAPGVVLLPARGGGNWEADEDEARTPPADGDGTLMQKDPHLWLDPMNAIAIARVAALKLAALDQAHAAHYSGNEAMLEQRIKALDAKLKSELAGIRDQPFVVFHDAYQYFERRYGLTAIGSIMIDPEHQPGARRLHEIHDKIVETNARCVFREPQFEPALLRTVTAGTKARTGMLDPLGAEIPEGPNLYPRLMERLANDLLSCLRPGG